MLIHRMTGFEGPIFLAVSASRWLAIAMRGAHLAAFVSVYFSVPMSLPGVLALVAVVANGVRVERALTLPAAQDIVSVLLSSGDAWTLILRDGRQYDAMLVRAIVLGSALTSCAVRLEDGRMRYLALLADNCEAAARRRLRVRLRLRAGSRTQLSSRD